MKTVKNIRQHDRSDCAVACIAAIAIWYGLKLPLITIREACGAGKQGTTIKGIIDACAKIGLSAKAFKSADKNTEPLEKINKPAILHFVKENGDLHFVVLCRADGKIFEIMDPADGEHHKLNKEKLQREWSGYLVIMSPDVNFEKGDKTNSLLSNYIKLLQLHRHELLLSAAGAIVYIVIGISTSLFLQQIIDNVLPDKDFNKLTQVGSIMTALMIAALFIGYWRIMFSIKAGLGMDCRLITKYLDHLFGLPVGFFALRGSGELNSRIGDAMKIRSFLTEDITAILVSAITLIVSFTLMFTYYWKLALLTLMFIPVYVVLYYISDKVNKRVNRDIIESAAAFEEKTVEGITAVKTIKYFGSEGIFASEIENHYLRFARKLYEGGRYAGIFATSSDAISKVLTIVLLITGSIFIFKGELSIGELISFYSMTAFFSTPLSQLVGINKNITEANISAKRLFEIIDLEREKTDGFDIELDKSHLLAFRNVKFSYPGSLSLLENFSINIEPGKITAITGESGCGKSSVASLIMRGYKPQSGSITIKDVDISLIRMSLWRNYVSLVPQETVLMNRTIIENISCGDPNPDIEKIVVLIEELGLSNFIESLPLGLIAKTGEGGCLLSGGQKQRIALARALYKEPKILILDESTSSLDEESEKFILNKIKSLRDSGISIIMITHKTDNIKIADNIINMSAHSGV